MERVPVVTFKDPTDLEANRVGRLSTRQIQTLAEWLAKVPAYGGLFVEHHGHLYGEPTTAWLESLRADVNGGATLTTDGMVAAGRVSSASVEGLLEGRGAVGLPGSYRLYYLPRSHLVVSAEPLEPESTMRERHRAELRTRLEALNTSVETVLMNRGGRVSPEQFAKGRRGSQRVAVGCVALLVPLGVVLGSELVTNGPRFWTIATSAALLLLAGIVIKQALEKGRDQRVLARDGVMRGVSIGALGLFGTPTSGEEYDSNAFFAIELDSGATEMFRLDSADSKVAVDPVTVALVPGERYRVYARDGHDGKALAIEPLPLGP